MRELAPNDVVNDPYFGPISKATAASGRLIEKQIKQNIKDNNSVGATGQLINAINSSDAILEGPAIVVRVGAGGVSYAAAVEYGSKAHAFPPHAWGWKAAAAEASYRATPFPHTRGDGKTCAKLGGLVELSRSGAGIKLTPVILTCLGCPQLV